MYASRGPWQPQNAGRLSPPFWEAAGACEAACGKWKLQMVQFMGVSGLRPQKL